MKQSDIIIGGVYLTRIGGVLARVVVVEVRKVIPAHVPKKKRAKELPVGDIINPQFAGKTIEELQAIIEKQNELLARAHCVDTVDKVTRTTFLIRREEETKLLPKARTAAALRPIDALNKGLSESRES